MSKTTLHITSLPDINLREVSEDISETTSRELQRIDDSLNGDGVLTADEIDGLDGRADGTLNLERLQYGGKKIGPIPIRLFRHWAGNQANAMTKQALAEILFLKGPSSQLHEASSEILVEIIKQDEELTENFDLENSVHRQAILEHCNQIYSSYLTAHERQKISHLVVESLFYDLDRPYSELSATAIESLQSAQTLISSELYGAALDYLINDSIPQSLLAHDIFTLGDLIGEENVQFYIDYLDDRYLQSVHDPYEQAILVAKARDLFFAIGNMDTSEFDNTKVDYYYKKLQMLSDSLFQQVIVTMVDDNTEFMEQRQVLEVLYQHWEENYFAAEYMQDDLKDPLQRRIELAIYENFRIQAIDDEYNTQHDNDASFFFPNSQCGPTSLAMVFDSLHITSSRMATYIADNLFEENTFLETNIIETPLYVANSMGGWGSLPDNRSLPVTVDEKIHALCLMLGISKVELHAMNYNEFVTVLSQKELDALITTAISLGIQAEPRSIPGNDHWFGHACAPTHYFNYETIADAMGLQYQQRVSYAFRHSSLPWVLEHDVQKMLNEGSAITMLIEHTHTDGSKGRHYVYLKEVVYDQNDKPIGIRVHDPNGQMTHHTRGWGYEPVRKSGNDNFWSLEQINAAFTNNPYHRMEVYTPQSGSAPL